MKNNYSKNKNSSNKSYSKNKGGDGNKSHEKNNNPKDAFFNKREEYSKHKSFKNTDNASKPKYSAKKDFSKPRPSFRTKEKEVISPIEYFPRNDNIQFNALTPIRKIDLQNSLNVNLTGKKRDKSNKNDERLGQKAQLVSDNRKNDMLVNDRDVNQDDSTTGKSTDLTDDLENFNYLNNVIKFETNEKTAEELENQESRALRPKLETGDLVLLCICEIKKDYMIGNYTRNKKAIIHREYSGFNKDPNFQFSDYFYIGQFVSAAIVSPEYDRITSKNSGEKSDETKHYKMKCSIEPHIINSGLNVDTLIEGMDLWGQLVKEKDSFSPNFGINLTSNFDKKLDKFNNSLKALKLNEDEDEEEEDEEEDEEDEEEAEEAEDDEEDEEESVKKVKKTKNSKHVTNIEMVFDNHSQLLLSSDTSKILKDLKKQYSSGDNLEEEIKKIKSSIRNFSFHFFKILSIEKKSNKEENYTTIKITITFSKLLAFYPLKNKHEINKIHSKNSSSNNYNPILSKEKIDFSNVKPGMIFSCVNTNKTLVNGIEVAFGNNMGTIFEDHYYDFNINSSFGNENLNNVTQANFNTVPKKLYARVIQVSSNKNQLALSAKENITKLFNREIPSKKELLNQIFVNGQNNFEVAICKKMFGDSYIVDIIKNEDVKKRKMSKESNRSTRSNKDTPLSFKAFFHYSHINLDGVNKYKSYMKQAFEKAEKNTKKDKKNKKEEDGEEDEKIENKKEKSPQEYDILHAITKNLRVKEFNYFDNNPHLEIEDSNVKDDKKTPVNNKYLIWESLYIGQKIRTTVAKKENDKLILRVNDFIKGRLTNDHLADVPLNLKLINKFKTNSIVEAVVFDVNPSTNKLVFTLKPSFENILSKSEIKENMVINMVYMEKDLFQHCGDVKGKLLNFKEVNKETAFKSGYVYPLKIVKIFSHDKMLLSSKDEVIDLEKFRNKKDKTKKEKKEKVTFKLAFLKHNKLALNSEVSGYINGIKGAYIYIYLGQNSIGKIHINNFFEDNFDSNVEKLKEYLDETVSKTEDGQYKMNDEKLCIRGTITKINQIKNLNTKIYEIIPEKTLNLLKVDKKINSEFERFNSVNDDITDKNNQFDGIISHIHPENSYPVKINYGVGHNIENVNIPFYNLPIDMLVPGETFSSENLEIQDKIKFFALNQNKTGTKRKNSMKNDTKNYSLSSNPILLNPTQKDFSKVIQNNTVYPVRIIKAISGRGLIVSFYFKFDEKTQSISQDQGISGFCDLTEISDLNIPNALTHFNVGSVVLARVLSFDSSINKHIVSLRKSLVNEETYKVLSLGSTNQANKILKDNTNPLSVCDLRNKMFKFGFSNVIEQNIVSLGYVTSSSPKGVFIRLSKDLVVRAPLNEVSDDRVIEPFNLVSENQLVLTRIISVTNKSNKDSNKDSKNASRGPNYNASLRESIVKFNMTLKLKDLNKNSFYNCLITGTNRDNVLIANIVGSTFNGEVKIEKNKSGINSSYNIGDVVVLECTELNKESFPPSKIVLSNANLRQEIIDQGLIINSLTDQDLEQNKVFSKLYSEIKRYNEEYKAEKSQKELADIDLMTKDIDLENNIQEVDYVKDMTKQIDESEDEDDESEVNVKDRKKFKKNTKKDMEDDEVNDDSDEESDGEISEGDIIYDLKRKQELLGNLGLSNMSNQMDIDDDEDEDIEDVEDDENEDDEDDIEDNDEEEDEENEEEENEEEENVEEEQKQGRKKLTSTAKREKDALKSEKAVRQRENQILAKEIQEKKSGLESFTSVEDFEKKILKNPNSSELWILYAAFILDKSKKYALSKKILDRAIKAVDITELKEKLNIWVAYLNLENTYGKDPVEFQRIVEEAIKVNDKKKILKHLILIYRRNGNTKLIYEGYRMTLRSYKNDIALWKEFLEYTFTVKNSGKESEIDDFKQPKDVLSQAIQCLIVSNKKIEMMIHYGGLHYKNNLVEQGKTIFELLIKEHPKRTDIWLVYLEKESSFNTVDNARFLFRKCLEKDHKTKGLKQIVTKYIEFEKQHGSKEEIEKASRFVTEIMKEKMENLKDNENKEKNMDIDDEFEEEDN